MDSYHRVLVCLGAQRSSMKLERKIRENGSTHSEYPQWGYVAYREELGEDCVDADIVQGEDESSLLLQEGKERHSTKENEGGVRERCGNLMVT